MIKAAIFDMDGLLIDSEPLWQQAEIECFAEVGIELTVPLCRQTMGMRATEMVAFWLRQHPRKDCTESEMAQKILWRLRELIASRAKPMPGVYETISRLKELGVPMVIASSSPQVVIDTVIDTFKLRDAISTGLSAEAEPLGKPHPGVFLAAARHLGVAPEDCIVFEDSINGVIAAKAARMITFAVPDPELFDRFEFSIADYKLRSLLDFSPALVVETATELA